MAEFSTVGLEDVIEAFSRREQATVEAVPKMLQAGVPFWYRHSRKRRGQWG